MAWAHAADGTRIHYRTYGPRDGEPLLAIQGLGADSRGWIMQRHRIGSRYRLLMPDNRGVGHSDAPPGPYDLEVMAGDALAVLDAEGVASAHVMGASMGGVLSQVIAVRHPERVRSLVLACTACRHLPWRRELLGEWVELAEERGMRAFVQQEMRWMVGMRSFRRIWPLLTVIAPLVFDTPVASFAAQVRAILDMDDALRPELAGVRAPTLVTCGSQDILTPIGDSVELAERIPTAELAVVRGGAHLFMVEQANAFNATVREFLDRVSVAVATGDGARAGAA